MRSPPCSIFNASCGAAPDSYSLMCVTGWIIETVTPKYKTDVKSIVQRPNSIPRWMIKSRASSGHIKVQVRMHPSEVRGLRRMWIRWKVVWEVDFALPPGFPVFIPAFISHRHLPLQPPHLLSAVQSQLHHYLSTHPSSISYLIPYSYTPLPPGTPHTIPKTIHGPRKTIKNEIKTPRHTLQPAHPKVKHKSPSLLCRNDTKPHQIRKMKMYAWKYSESQHRKDVVSRNLDLGMAA